MPFLLLGLGASDVNLDAMVESSDVLLANADQLRAPKRPREAHQDQCRIARCLASRQARLACAVAIARGEGDATCITCCELRRGAGDGFERRTRVPC